MSDPTTTNNPTPQLLTKEQILQQYKTQYGQQQPGSNPRADEFLKRDAVQQFGEMGLPADQENSGAPSDWTLMRPDLPSKVGTALARGGMKAWNGIFRFAAGGLDSLQQATRPDFIDKAMVSTPEGRAEKAAHDKFYSLPRDQRQYFALNNDGTPGMNLTFTPDTMNSLAGPEQGGIFGIVESLTEFGVEFFAGGKILKGVANLPTALATAGAAVGEGTFVAEAASAVAGWGLRAMSRLEQMKLTQGALQGAVKAAAFDDPYAERVSSFIAEAPPELGEALQAYIDDTSWVPKGVGTLAGGALDKSLAAMKPGAKALRPDVNDSMGKAQAKSMLEDYLLGVPFAAAGLLYGATVKRLRKGLDLKKITEKEATALLKEAREEYEAAIKAGAEHKLLGPGEGGSNAIVKQTEDGMWQVFRKELDTGVEEGADDAAKALGEGAAPAVKKPYTKPGTTEVAPIDRTPDQRAFQVENAANRARSPGQVDDGLEAAIAEKGMVDDLARKAAADSGNTVADAATKADADTIRGELGKGIEAPAAVAKPIGGEAGTNAGPGRVAAPEAPKVDAPTPDAKPVSKVIKDIPGPKFKTKQEAEFAAGAVDMHFAADKAAKEAVNPETLDAIRKAFKEVYKNGKGDPDPRSIAEVLSKYGINAKYMQGAKDSIGFIKAMVDVLPEASEAARMKPTTVAQVIDRAKELFGRKIDPAKLEPALARLGVELKDAEAVMTAAKGYMVLQQRQVKKLALLMDAHPGNEAVENMLLKSVQNLHDIHAAFTGSNAKVARTLSIPNKITGKQYAAEFGLKGSKDANQAMKDAVGGEAKQGAEAAVKNADEPGSALAKQGPAIEGEVVDDAAKGAGKKPGDEVIDGEFYDIGESRLSRKEALDLGRLVAMSDDADVDGMMKVIAGPTLGDISKAAPAVQRDLVQEFLGARVEMILSGFDTQLTNIASGLHRLLTNPAELAWYGVTRFEPELVKDSWHLVVGQFAATFDAVRFMGKAFRLGRSIIDPGETVENAAKPLALSTDMITKPSWDTVKALASMPSRSLVASDEFFSQIHYRAKARMDIARNIRQRIADGSLDPSKMKIRRAGDVIDVTDAEKLAANRKLGGGTDKALPANAGGAGGGAVPTAGEMTSDDPIKELADRLLKASVDEGSGRGIYGAGIKYARDATYKTELEGTPKAFQNFVNSHPIGRFFFPFVRAPSNIFDFIWQSTPGLNLLNKNMTAAIEKGGEDAARAIARSEFGAMMYGVAGYWAASGMITGAGPQDPKVKASWEALGYKPYTFTTDDGTRYSYRKGDPFFASLGIMADFWAASGDIEEGQRHSMAAAVMSSFAANATSKSYMSNVDTLMQALSSKDPNKMEKLFGTVVHTSLVPAVVAKGNTDPYEREVQSVWDAVKQRVPGYSETLEPRMNVFGDHVMKAPGWANRAMNPFTEYAPIKNDYVASEFIKLGRSLPDLPQYAPGFGNSIDLTDRKYFGGSQKPDGTFHEGQSPRSRWYELMGEMRDPDTGQNMKQKLEEIMQDDGWKNMTSDSAYQEGGKKFQLASQVLLGFREMAYAKLLTEYPALQQAQQEETLVMAAGEGGGDTAAKGKARELRGVGKLLHRYVEK